MRARASRMRPSQGVASSGRLACSTALLVALQLSALPAVSAVVHHEIMLQKQRRMQQSQSTNSYVVQLHRGAPSYNGGASAVQIAPSSAAVSAMMHTLTQRTADEADQDFFAHVYTNMTTGRAFAGFGVQLSRDALEFLYSSSVVARIEPDVMLHYVQSPPPGGSPATPAPSPAFQQGDAPYQLDRIDEREPSITDGTYRYTLTGEGIDIYVVDSGINTGHVEFTGRLAPGINFSPDGGADNVEDCNGHGTHVAGLAAGETFGVAKAARIIPVRVYDCSNEGPLSTTLQALNWVMMNMETSGRRSVINMSFGGARAPSLDDAVAVLTSAGAVCVAAAGNENTDACFSSPAAAPQALTVGAVDSGDRVTSFSNFGSCVDLFAPGEDLRSAWIGSSRATARLSGTSMAAPLASGVAALYLQANRGAAPRVVNERLTCSATRDVLRRIPDFSSPNLLLYAPPAGFTPDGACVTSAAPAATLAWAALAGGLLLALHAAF